MTPPDVRAQSAAVASMASDWPLLDALTGGTRAMRAAGKTLLPKFPAEDDGAYKDRLQSAVLTNFFGRTCAVMASKPFSQEMTFDTVATAIAPMVEDIDGMGTDLQAFGEMLLRQCLSHGLAGVMVDYPAGNPARNRAEERASGLRPYWSMYPAATILGFKAQRIGGEWVLMQLRLLESVTGQDGRFGEKRIEQVRVLEPGIWEIWRKPDATKPDWIIYETGTTTLNIVPFQFFYGSQTGFGTGVSPLIDLAYLNCEHWQSSSDQQTIMHVARIPILFGCGFTSNEPLAVGGSTAIIVNQSDAKLSFVEHGGKAIDAGRQSLLDLEERMRQSGAELLVKRRANVTATQVVSESDASKCLLQSIVERFEDGLNACLALTGKWLGEADAGEIELFKDFGVDSLSDASAALLLDAAIAGVMSRETFFEEMRRRTIIDSDRDWTTEAERLKAQPPVTPEAAKLPVHPGRAD